MMHYDGSTYIPKGKADPIRCWHEPPADHEDLSWWDGPGWYFYDETWANLHGPFATYEECQETLRDYALSL
jgi:hypothetical protein